MPQVLIDMFQTLWADASSQPILLLLILGLGGWLLFQRTYITVILLCLLFFAYIMGDHYGFTN